jgi:pilus assembly protein CpaC
MKKNLLILAIMLTGAGAVVIAQAPAVPASAIVAASGDLAPTDTSAVRLLVGRSTIVNVGSTIARVSLTSADVADALVTSHDQLLVHGKVPGTISMFVWDRANVLRRYEVVVQRDLAQLSEQMAQLFPNEQITVQSNGRSIVLSGMVSRKDIIDQAMNVAAGYVASKDEVVTLLQLQPDGPSNQVLLRVRFAEVSRSAMTELGVNLAANGANDGRWFGRSTTQQFAAPEWDEQGRFVFSDFLNLFLFDAQENLAAVVKALQGKGLFQSLAEPNLVAESGKEASFLAGGEFPIPIAQGSGANIGVSVEFKEFGIRLNFTPTVNGDRIHLKVRPEVSALDFSNAVLLQGFRIPALTTRRTETELELRNGQTFAIAGLMNNTMNSTMQKIPGIGDIPILGLLFKSKAAQKNETELVVMITPEILPLNSPGVTPNLPRIQEPFMPPQPSDRLMDMPPPAFSSSAPRAAAPARPAAAPAQAPTGATAAAALASLAPLAPRVVETGIAGPIVTPTVPPAPSRPLSESEQRVLDQARREEQGRSRLGAAPVSAPVETKVAAATRAQDDTAARDQAKTETESARRADDVAARLRAAEAAYQAELEKETTP